MDARTAAANRPLSDGATSNESLRGRTQARMDAADEMDQRDTVGHHLIALRTADRRKDEFIAMLAHELRGPLAPIRMAAAILSQPHAAAAACEQARKIIDRQVNDMARLIDELLDVARMTHGKLQLDPTRLDLMEVVQRSLDVVRPALADREQQLSVSLPCGPCYVRGDTARLQQVFSNLLTNASKFSKRGGRIWLSVGTDARGEHMGDVSVQIRDEGIGITATRLAHIFELFEQAGESPHGARGLGVGLALVQQVVELHGGHVRAVSAGTDQGSAFTVVLPLLEVPLLPAPTDADSI